MHKTIAEIINKIEDMRLFADSSYLKTTHFAVFLLFGCTDTQKNTFVRRTNEIISDRRTIAILNIENAEEAPKQVWAARREVSESGATISSLNHIHLCPLVITDNTQPELFEHAVSNIEKMMAEHDIQTEWKPFLLINTELYNAASWLDTMSETIRMLGSAKSCRCCVLTREDEAGFFVAEERLLSTVLFVALLHVVNETQREIGERIAYRGEDNNLFYTAQTAFVSNPIITRTLYGLRTLLKNLMTHNKEQDLDMRFMSSILEPFFDKMPKNDGIISLTPLLGVIPDPEGDTQAFANRLRAFAEAHYLVENAENENDDLKNKIQMGFLRAFIASERPIQYLHWLQNNRDEIKKLCHVGSELNIQISELPKLSKKSGIRDEDYQVYVSGAKWLHSQLLKFSVNILTDFFQSPEFLTMPKRIATAYDHLKKAVAIIEEKIETARHTEIPLPLLNDLLDTLPEATLEEMANDTEVAKCVSELIFAEIHNDEEAKNEMAKLLLVRLSGLTRGISNAATYMELVSANCSNPTGEIAKGCVSAISKQLVFPLRFNDNHGHERYTFVWGNENNHLYHALDQNMRMLHTEKSNTFLPLVSQERFVLLSVSKAFTQTDILGVARVHEDDYKFPFEHMEGDNEVSLGEQFE